MFIDTKHRAHKAERMRPHMRQAVTISGLGQTAFDRALENMEKIQIAFMASIGQREVEPFQPASYHGHFAIDAHNKYFTKKRLVPNEGTHPFHPSTDPDGVLASLENYEFVHIADNHVDYLGPVTLGGTTK